MKRLALIVLAGLIGVGLLWRQGRQLDAERAAHAATAAALEQCRAAAAQSLTRAGGLSAQAAACMAREARRDADDAARAAVMAGARPAPRPDEQQDLVVDDATRRAVVRRLNRPW